MPSFSQHQSSSTTKLLLLGDSGAGKTGACIALAAAGYNVRYVDCDAGLDLLRDLVFARNSPYPKDTLDRVHYKTLTDPMKSVGGKLIPSKATVWQRLTKLLDHWKTDDEDLGPISSWGTNDVLVLDSLTTIATAAMNFVLSMNARLGQQAQQGDWYQGQQLLEGLLQLIYDEGVKCNVIVLAHLAYIGDDRNPEKGYPASLGKALSPKIGRYFNSMLLMRTKGTGDATKRELVTTSTGLIELKTTAPLSVEKSYPIATGLADYFKAVRAPAAPGEAIKRL